MPIWRSELSNERRGQWKRLQAIGCTAATTKHWDRRAGDVMSLLNYLQENVDNSLDMTTSDDNLFTPPRVIRRQPACYVCVWGSAIKHAFLVAAIQRKMRCTEDTCSQVDVSSCYFSTARKSVFVSRLRLQPTLRQPVVRSCVHRHKRWSLTICYFIACNITQIVYH